MAIVDRDYLGRPHVRFHDSNIDHDPKGHVRRTIS